MTEQLISQVITGAPNFIGFILAIFVLQRQLAKMDELVRLLVDKWEACEDDSEKARLASNKVSD